jgi:hypothetical protein
MIPPLKKIINRRLIFINHWFIVIPYPAIAERKMDRFSSREDVNFNDADFAAGAEARRNGLQIKDCPFRQYDWRLKSWVAGWCDEDQSIAAEIHA